MDGTKGGGLLQEGAGGAHLEGGGLGVGVAGGDEGVATLLRELHHLGHGAPPALHSTPPPRKQQLALGAILFVGLAAPAVALLAVTLVATAQVGRFHRP
jgi:hypothetical protein